MRVQKTFDQPVEEAWAQLIEEVTHAGTYLIVILVKAKTCSTHEGLVLAIRSLGQMVSYQTVSVSPLSIS